MASSTDFLKDMDENFCQCPICLEPYREPKLLPCTHRYCYECLKGLTDSDPNSTIVECPECRDGFPIPSEGVDGFKTDFNMKKMVEYIQSQKSLEDEKVQECCACSKELKVTAYCLKCYGFLCQECQNYHLTRNSLKDHKQHTFSLKNLKSMNMTIEQLVDMKEAPRCMTHPENLCRLCCKTCNNVPVCMTCTIASHKGHKYDDVSLLANEKMEELKKELEIFQRYEERIKAARQSAENFQRDLSFDFGEARNQFHVRYDREVKSTNTEMKYLTEKYDREVTETEETKKEELKQTNRQMEEEIAKVKRKYQNICNRIEKAAEHKINDLTENYKRQTKKKEDKLVILKQDRRSFDTKIQNREVDEFNISQQFFEQISDIEIRSENSMATARNILETKNDWMAVQKIPDIRTEMKALYVKMEKELFDVEILSRRPTHFCVEMAEEETPPVCMEGIEARKWEVNGITNSDDNKIVITGRTSNVFQSHITVIDKGGNIIREEVMQGSRDWSYRFCAALSPFTVATVCRPNEIGLYDVDKGSLLQKTTVVNNKNDWPAHLFVTCVAVDFAKNHILVGSNSSDMFVYDYRLKFRYTFKLPEIIKYPYAMTVSGNNLLVCDNAGRQAYLVSMGGSKGKVIHEFAIPNLNGTDFRPTSVCTDKNGFIYILWKGTVAGEWKCFLVRYRQDGLQILTITFVDKDAQCMAIFETEKREKIRIATRKSGKLYVYNLWSI